MKRKKIALFFVGGENAAIKSQKEFKNWLNTFPEVRLLADVSPFFIAPEKSGGVDPDFWNALGKAIYSELKKHDGFIIIHPLDSIIFTAAALSFTIQPLGRPAVFIGSAEAYVKSGSKKSKGGKWNDLSVRGNIINAVHVSTLDLGEAVILAGSRLFRASRTKKSAGRDANVFETDDLGIAGRTDFSVHLTNSAKKRANVKPKLFYLEKDVVVMDIYPGFDPKLIQLMTKNKKAVLAQVRDMNALEQMVQYFEKLKIPTVFHLNNYSKKSKPVSGDLIFSNTYTFEAALAKLMWALGKTARLKDLKRIFTEDFTGESL